MQYSLNQLCKVNVSTYENYSMEDVYDVMQSNLEEVSIAGSNNIKYIDKNNEVQIIDINKVNIEDGLDFNQFKIEIAADFGREILANVPDFIAILQKYGFIFKEWDFYTPEYYNFENDSIYMKLEEEVDPKYIDVMSYGKNIFMAERWLRDHGLYELVEQYIKEERKASCDGYMSFEPSIIDEIEHDSYAVLWAIFKKENIFDTIEETLQHVVDESYSEEVRANCDDRYYWIDGDSKQKYSLDYDAKLLIPYID